MQNILETWMYNHIYIHMYALIYTMQNPSGKKQTPRQIPKLQATRIEVQHFLLGQEMNFHM